MAYVCILSNGIVAQVHFVPLKSVIVRYRRVGTWAEPVTDEAQVSEAQRAGTDRP